MYSTAVCPYCQRAEMLLKSKGVAEIEKIRIDLDPAQPAEVEADEPLVAAAQRLDPADDARPAPERHDCNAFSPT